MPLFEEASYNSRVGLFNFYVVEKYLKLKIFSGSQVLSFGEDLGEAFICPLMI